MKIYMMRFCRERMCSVQGFVMDVVDDLKNLQHLVRGMIQTVPVGEKTRILLVCNDEGKINGLPINRLLLVDAEDGEFELLDTINGDCLAVRFDGADGFCSIENEDIPIIQKYLRPIEYYENNVIMLEESNCMTLKEMKKVMGIEKVQAGVFLKLLDDIIDRYTPIDAGAYFKVDCVDDIGQIHGSWLAPYKSSLAINPDVDSFQIVQGGFDEIRQKKLHAIYSQIGVDIEKMQEFPKARFEELVNQFYDYQITDSRLMEKSWELYFEYKAKQKK